MQKMVVHVRKMYEDFKPKLPIMYDLLNPALQKRHFEQLSAILGIKITKELEITLKALLSAGIMDH